MRIDATEFAVLDKRCNHRQVVAAAVGASEQSILSLMEIYA